LFALEKGGQARGVVCRKKEFFFQHLQPQGKVEIGQHESERTTSTRAKGGFFHRRKYLKKLKAI